MALHRQIPAWIAGGIFCALTGIGIQNIVTAKADGAPSGNTGSPDDGQTCAHSMCHSGTAQSRSGLITTNIPASGYLSGETYLITVTIAKDGIERFGFQASPQNLDGDKMGVMTVINDLETKLTGAGKYITHKSTGTSGTDSRTWTFNWTPDASSGDVGFYVAVNASNNEDNATGDSIYFDALIIPEDPENIPAAIHETAALTCNVLQLSDDLIKVYVTPEGSEDIVTRIVDLQGRVVSEEIQQAATGEFELSAAMLEAGCYFVVVEQGNRRYVKQIIKA